MPFVLFVLYPHSAQRISSGGDARRPVSMALERFRPATHIGVDLGTANTLVYVKGSGIVLNEPSVVVVEQGSRAIRAFGSAAKKMLGRTPDALLGIRPMKDGVIADVDLAEAMIRHYITQATADRVFRTKPRVVVGVPSGITELERRAVRQSALAAGAREVYMVSEPMAAAIGVGLPVDAPIGNMVIDIGGGTTEVTVLALNGIVSDASIRVGGTEMDEAIISYCRKSYNLLIGDATAESIKMEIGSAIPLQEERALDVKGRDLVTGIPRVVRISSRDVREALRDPVQQIIEAVLRVFEMTPPELAADVLDRGIILTGGGSQLQGLDQLIAQSTGLPVFVDADPLTSVVRGTAKILDEWPRYMDALST